MACLLNPSAGQGLYRGKTSHFRSNSFLTHAEKLAYGCEDSRNASLRRRCKGCQREAITGIFLARMIMQGRCLGSYWQLRTEM
jgi:hypothetical protein